jgi:uncharacterized protein YuzE
MRLTYDAEVDAAFVYVAEKIGDGEVDHSREVPELAAGTMTLFHFDSQGKVLGIEFVGASKLLPPEALRDADPE